MTDDWQPIETAPKDGTVIDLWMTDETGDGHRVPDAWWVTDTTYTDVIFSEDGSHKRVHGRRDGWYAANHGYDNESGWADYPRRFNPHPRQQKEIFREPTHWMPLPAPPMGDSPPSGQ